MALSNQQILELQKLQKILSQLEKIFLVSYNEDQKKRVSKDIQKYKTKILAISPEGIPDNIHLVHIEKDVPSQSSSNDSQPSYANTSETYAQKGYLTRDKVLSNLVIMKISPHSHDQEINFIATLITVFESEYVPVLGDSHIKFDFSHIAERDNILKHIENIHRTMKVLTETIEEYALSEKQDFKEQLGRMKNKQSRIFIAEAGDLFKAFRDFITSILNNVEQGVGIIMNLEERIHFNSRFERATILEGKTIPDALNQFLEYIYACLENINVPGIKK
ncbi:MAG: hypothetical protein SFU98_08925 [Leptospiraceae bacterium]|nr:hypothetical protein [Leptospiraceae bacterium]